MIRAMKNDIPGWLSLPTIVTISLIAGVVLAVTMPRFILWVVIGE